MGSEMSHIMKAYCNRCHNYTSHDILRQKTIKDPEDVGEGNSLDSWDKYSMIECRGCHSIKLMHEHSFSEDVDPSGNVRVHKEYYPPLDKRKKPSWMSDFFAWYFRYGDQPLARIHEEVYISLRNKCMFLSSMGVRAILEQIMIMQIGDQGNFDKNIDEFARQGHISPKQKEIFKKILEMGHASAHRGYEPNERDVEIALGITEGLMHQVFVAEGQVSKMAEKIPARVKVARSRKE